MKDGVLLANSGHFDVEINMKELGAVSSGASEVKPLVREFKILAKGSK